MSVFSHPLSALSHTIHQIGRMHLELLDVPSVWARRSLTEFCERFDEASADLARQDDWDWERVFERLHLVEDVGLSRSDARRYIGALCYGVALDGEVLEPVRLWRVDWQRLLGDAASMSKPNIDVLSLRHMGVLWRSAMVSC